MTKKIIRISIVPILFLLFLFQNIKLAEAYHQKAGVAGVIWSDAYGYYEYLPTIFIRHTPENLRCGLRVNDSTTVNKYTCGVALLQSPFFFANHSIQTLRGFSGTGFENSYGYAIILSTSFYTFLGLWMLFILLKEWFSLKTAIISILIVLYGTNMFHYVYGEPGMSHAYSFFCFSGFLFFTNLFYKNPRFGFHFFALAILGSLAVLIRPTNIIMLLAFFGFNCYNYSDIKNRFKLFFTFYWLIPTFILTGLLIFLPQIYYWNLTTGKLIVYSYGYNQESFTYWKNPQILEVLFGRIAGWLPYSPIMLFSIVSLPFMIYKKKYNGILILVILVLITYICASWWAYNFLCAFGYRSFVEYYPLFILPLSYLIQSIFDRNKKILSVSMLIFIAAFLYVGVRMNFQYSPVPWCFEDQWSWRDYFKLYEKFF